MSLIYDLTSQQPFHNTNNENLLDRNNDQRLNFWYYSRSQTHLLLLREHFEKKTDYDIGVPVNFEGEWVISGTSSHINSSEEIFGTWVEKMIEVAERFHCEFDGWSTKDYKH